MASDYSFWDEGVKTLGAIVGASGLSGVAGWFWTRRLRRAQQVNAEKSAEHHETEISLLRAQEGRLFESAVNERVKLIFSGYETQISALKDEVSALRKEMGVMQQTLERTTREFEEYVAHYPSNGARFPAAGRPV